MLLSIQNIFPHNVFLPAGNVASEAGNYRRVRRLSTEKMGSGSFFLQDWKKAISSLEEILFPVQGRKQVTLSMIMFRGCPGSCLLYFERMKKYL